MKTLIIQTQYRENYAAHNRDYEHGVDEPHWKFKGGTTYYVSDLTERDINYIAHNGIPSLTALIEFSNEASEEYILNWEIVDDGPYAHCEKWETPVEFYYHRDEDIASCEWRCRTFRTNDPEYTRWDERIRARAEQWTPGLAGNRVDGSYKCQYKTKNGWFDMNHPQLEQELKEAVA